MRIGLATSAFPDLDVVSAVKMCLRYSDHVHISPIYPTVSDAELKELLTLQKYFGADFSVHAPFPNEGVIADLGTEKGREMFIRSIDFTNQICGDRLVFHTSAGNQREDMIEHARELSALCEQSDIKACFENRPEDDALMRTRDDITGFLGEVPGSYLCFDTSHYYMWKKDLDDLFDTIKTVQDRIGVIHMVDTFRGQDAHLLPGFGEISMYELAKTLVDVPNIKSIPIVLEDQEPFEYPQGILNLRHALVSRKGLIDRNVSAEEEQG
ncbi:MAG: TIM barrel protein [Candidatus Altiarchaeota archaeon]